MMQKESVFFAVGAAHLAGELGVNQFIKKSRIYCKTYNE